MNDRKFLFDMFSPVPAKQWKQKIQMDLKGEDYSTLITRTLEGIDIKPFYHRDEYMALPFEYEPRDFQLVHYYDFIPRNNLIAFSVNNLADKIYFIAKEPFDTEIFKNFDLDITVHLNFYDSDFIRKLIDENFHFIWDPISHLIQTGNWFENQSKDFNRLENLIGKENFSLEIDTAHLQNAGANIVQQIAYGLSMAYEYYKAFGTDILPHICFKNAVGYHYFFEIAKFKAWRYLWKEILSDEKQVRILSLPSVRNMTLFDPYVNMLRTGMEMMAAVLGGSDEVANLPYNYVFKKFDKHAFRLASNQLILLKEESKFNAMRQAKEGSYYIEEIAYRLAKKSLELFKQIEKSGGFPKQLYNGTIQRKIRENAKKEQQLFDEGKIVLTGTNKYIMEDEKAPAWDKNPFVKKKNEKTLIEKIIPKRLSEKIEKERLKKRSNS